MKDLTPELPGRAALRRWAAGLLALLLVFAGIQATLLPGPGSERVSGEDERSVEKDLAKEVLGHPGRGARRDPPAGPRIPHLERALPGTARLPPPGPPLLAPAPSLDDGSRPMRC